MRVNVELIYLRVLFYHALRVERMIHKYYHYHELGDNHCEFNLLYIPLVGNEKSGFSTSIFADKVEQRFPKY